MLEVWYVNSTPNHFMIPSNIEKSIRRGEYVAYTKSGVVRIRREGRGWTTYGAPIRFTGKNLIEINDKIKNYFDTPLAN